MGSEAWSHWSSDKDRLRILHSPSQRAESNLWRPGWPVHGEQHKMCRSFEELSEYLGRTNVSCLAMLPSLFQGVQELKGPCFQGNTQRSRGRKRGTQKSSQFRFYV